MSAKYRTVVTTAGAVKLAAATVPGGKKVNLTVMAVGDGGGSLSEPSASQTALVNEVWRNALNKISQDNKKKNYVVAELVIPPEVGGFWARELGLYDDAGTLIAVANMAESYKPELAEGSGRAQTCRMVIVLSSIESVELSIDASTVMATQDYVDGKLEEHELSRNHPDATLKEKGFTQLSSATDSESEVLAATPKAVKTAYDLANGKYTAADGTTAKKGLVQLSSATDSTSEALAATPKAVKAAYDNAEKRIKTSDMTSSHLDIVAGHVLQVGDYGLGVADGSAPFLSSIYDIKCSGEYNALGDGTSTPTTGVPEGSGNTRFAVSVGNIYANQYLVTLTSNVHFYVGIVNTATKTATWSKFYNTLNKPSATDVGAMPSAKVGSIADNGSMADAKTNGWYQVAVPNPSTVAGFPQNPDGTYLYGYGYLFSFIQGNVWFQLYFNHRGINATRQSWNAGPDTTTAWVVEYNTANKPTASDVGAYTKAECDARYVVDVQLGAGTSKTTWNTSGNWPKTAGYVITSVWKDASDYNLDGVVYAPLQKKIGSEWYTVNGGLA